LSWQCIRACVDAEDDATDCRMSHNCFQHPSTQSCIKTCRGL
jgi:hypothetical protein